MTETSRLRKKLFWFQGVVLGLMVLSITYGVSISLFRQMTKAVVREFSFRVERQVVAVSQWAMRAKDLARQIASRTRIRQELDKYNRKKISFDQLVKFTTPKLEDAMRQSRETVGITRLDAGGALVVSLGIKPPEEALQRGALPLADAIIGQVFERDGSKYIWISAPIVDRRGGQVGTDIISASVAELDRIIEAPTAVSTDSNSFVNFLVQPQSGTFQSVITNHRLEDGKIDSALQPQIMAAAYRAFDKRHAVQFNLEGMFGIIAPIKETPWLVVACLDQKLIRAPAYKELTGVLIVGLTAYFICLVGFWLVLRPLSRRMLIKESELEKEIEAKTAFLQQELTAREEAEERLAQEQQRLAWIVQGANAGTIEWNIQTGRIEINERWAQMLGYSREELQPFTIGKIRNLCHADDLEQSDPIIDNLLKGDLDSFEYEFRMRHKNGNWVWCLVRGKVVSWTQDRKPVLMSGDVQDITTRKQTEEALLKSEERYRDVARAHAGIVWEVDNNFIIRYFSGQVREILGCEPEEIIGRKFFSLLEPEEFERVGVLLSRLPQETEPIKDIDYWRRRTGDGRRVRISTISVSSFDSDGRFVGARGTHLDITESYLARIRRELYLQFHEMGLENDNAMCSLVNNACREHSDSPVTFFGLVEPNETAMSTAVYISDTMGDCLISDAPARFSIEDAGLWAEPIRRREPVIINDYSNAPDKKGLPEGHVPIFRYLGVPVLDGGRVIAIAGAANKKSPYDERDINRLKLLTDNIAVFLSARRKEKSLAESEKRYRLTFDAMPDAVAIYSYNKDVYIYANDGFYDLTGFTLEDVIGVSPKKLNLNYNLPIATKIEQELAEKGFITNLELQIQIKNGLTRDIYFSARPIEVDGEDCLITLAKDITEIKKAEKEKARLENQLRQANKMEALGTLAGGIAHDFNNILSAIIAYSELSLRSEQDLAAVQKNLSEILKAGYRAKDLVTQIMTFSRKLELKLKNIDLNEVIRQTEQMLARMIPKMIHIENRLADDLRLIRADAGQLTQLLMNLSTNARDAMPDGGRLIINTENMTLDEEYCRQHPGIEPGEYVLLTVSDTGQGMDKETIDHIFEPFFTKKEIGKGTGLGMATVYGIVKNHGGHINCCSEIGQGTSFKIFLPAVLSSDKAEEQSAATENQVQGGSETILVVDDERQIREIGQEILTTMGYSVLTAESGEEALAIYRDRGNDIGLIILDISMPGMGGRRCLQELLTINPEIKVIVSTGYAHGDRIRDLRALGAVGFVPKPFGITDMLRTVRGVLDGKQAKSREAKEESISRNGKQDQWMK